MKNWVLNISNQFFDGILLEIATSLFDIYFASYFKDFNKGRVFF